MMAKMIERAIRELLRERQHATWLYATLLRAMLVCRLAPYRAA